MRTVAVAAAPLDELLPELELELLLEAPELELPELELLELELLEPPLLLSSLQPLSRPPAAQMLKSVTARCLNRIVPPASTGMSGFLPPWHLSRRSLRGRCRLLTGAGAALAAALGLSGCSGASEEQLAALRAGRDAVTPCQERFHEESQTYADCARYVSQQAQGDARVREWRRLGALYTGWVHADMVGQQGDAPANQAARMLLGEALPLQKQLHAGDATLCEMVGVPCATLAERRRELLAPPQPAPR